MGARLHSWGEVRLSRVGATALTDGFGASIEARGVDSPSLSPPPLRSVGPCAGPAVAGVARALVAGIRSRRSHSPHNTRGRRARPAKEAALRNHALSAETGRPRVPSGIRQI